MSQEADAYIQSHELLPIWIEELQFTWDISLRKLWAHVVSMNKAIFASAVSPCKHGRPSGCYEPWIDSLDSTASYTE
ncbi:hypothetical protein BJX96DRAFT_159877 [Aspergillus floccosus]